MKKRVGKSLFALLCVSSFISLLSWGYVSIYRSIPTNIKLIAGEEQVLNLGVPVAGTIQKASNTSSISVNLNQPIAMKADQLDRYEMKLALFGILPLKTVTIDVMEDTMLTPAGIPIGIYVKTNGLLVIGVGDFIGLDGISYAPSKYVLEEGDYIVEVNGQALTKKQELVDRITECNGDPVILTVLRGDNTLTLQINPKQNQAGEYKAGIWIRDSAQGVGTLTFIDSEGHFGALGHGINDVDTGSLMTMSGGTLYDTDIIAIRKGEDGTPGEMTGLIDYADNHILGQITENSARGIYGVCEQSLLDKVDSRPIPVGLRQECVEGPAQILCTIDGETTYYDITIEKVNLYDADKNRGLELLVTDEELLEKTGGIVQGMSGSPIIQNGKLIGAVTHVFVNDPTRGYGIFIERMLGQ